MWRLLSSGVLSQLVTDWFQLWYGEITFLWCIITARDRLIPAMVCGDYFPLVYYHSSWQIDPSYGMWRLLSSGVLSQLVTDWYQLWYVEITLLWCIITARDRLIPAMVCGDYFPLVYYHCSWQIDPSYGMWRLLSSGVLSQLVTDWSQLWYVEITLLWCIITARDRLIPAMVCGDYSPLVYYHSSWQIDPSYGMWRLLSSGVLSQLVTDWSQLWYVEITLLWCIITARDRLIPAMVCGDYSPLVYYHSSWQIDPSYGMWRLLSSGVLSLLVTDWYQLWYGEITFLWCIITARDRLIPAMVCGDYSPLVYYHSSWQIDPSYGMWRLLSSGVLSQLVTDWSQLWYVEITLLWCIITARDRLIPAMVCGDYSPLVYYHCSWQIDTSYGMGRLLSSGVLSQIVTDWSQLWYVEITLLWCIITARDRLIPAMVCGDYSPLVYYHSSWQIDPSYGMWRLLSSGVLSQLVTDWSQLWYVEITLLWCIITARDRLIPAMVWGDYFPLVYYHRSWQIDPSYGMWRLLSSGVLSQLVTDWSQLWYVDITLLWCIITARDRLIPAVVCGDYSPLVYYHSSWQIDPSYGMWRLLSSGVLSLMTWNQIVLSDPTGLHRSLVCDLSLSRDVLSVWPSHGSSDYSMKSTGLDSHIYIHLQIEWGIPLHI